MRPSAQRLLLAAGFLAIIPATSARDEFDEELAVELFLGLSCLMTLPWLHMDFMVSGFDSGFLAHNRDTAFREPYASDQLGMDWNATKHTLWQSFKYADESVYFVYAGFKNGRIMGYYRMSTTDPSPVWTVCENENASCPEYGIDDHCRTSYFNVNPVTGALMNDHNTTNATETNREVSRYDPRWRPWYIKAISGTGSVWSDVYVFVDVLLPGITATSHIYTRGGEFLGVAAVDYLLSKIETTVFAAANIDPNSTFVYVVDSKGAMVAASVANVSVTQSGEQIAAVNCPEESIAGTARFLNTSADGFATSGIQTTHVEGQGWFWVQSNPYSDEYGLEWYVVVTELVECESGSYIGHDQCEPCPTHSACALDACPNVSMCSCESNYNPVFDSEGNLYCSFCPSPGVWENSTCTFDEKLNNPSWKVAWFGFSLVFVHFVAVTGFAVWTYRNLKTRVVVNAQPVFLFLILFGSLVGNVAIVPMVMDEERTSEAGADCSCMATVWLYCIGFALTFGSLLTKINRIRSIFAANSVRITKHHRVRVQDVIIWVVIAVCAEALLLLVWTAVSPLKYVRECDEYDVLGSGTCIESSAGCKDTHGNLSLVVFIPIIAAGHLIVLLTACYFSYLIRKINTEFQEGHWIAMCVLSQLQVNLLGGTVLLLLSGNPTTGILIRITVTFLNNASVVMLLFVPKIWSQAAGSPLLERILRSLRSMESLGLRKEPSTTDVELTRGATPTASNTNNALYSEQRQSGADLSVLERHEQELAEKDAAIRRLQKDVDSLSRQLRFRTKQPSSEPEDDGIRHDVASRL